VILHSSRSGRASNSTHDEFEGTAAWNGNNPDGLSWNATIGEDEIAIHHDADEWGHNARGCSDNYLAVEFAQPVESRDISDAQVDVFCWYFMETRKRWPELPLRFPTHAELDGTAEYGRFDGKSDVFSKGSPRADELRTRILERL
jgi:hypothetical protein